jgi:hypothetical protein
VSLRVYELEEQLQRHCSFGQLHDLSLGCDFARRKAFGADFEILAVDVE